MKVLQNLMSRTAFTFLLIILISCGQSQEKQDEAFKVFNEGVAYSLDANEEYDKGNYEKSEELNKKAISKFYETLSIDSAHKLAYSALGHSYYLNKQYSEGVKWFQKAIELDSTNAANYREFGLCKINLGDIKEGKRVIDKAFELDTTEEVRNITVLDLLNIGTLAFDYGNSYSEEGDKEKGLEYKRFSIAVLLTANQVDSNNQEVLQKIVEFADGIGETELSENFKQKLKE